MADTLEQMWRQLRVFVPQLPPLLAQTFIRDRYRRVLERRPWAGLRGEGELLIDGPKNDGTVALTRGMNLVTGTGTSFASTDVGRQFQVASGANTVYTITEVDVGLQTVTLDRVYANPTSTGVTYRIVDAYVTMPADFMRFIVVTDPRRGWKLRFWMTQEELSAVDPQRASIGQPWLLADRRFTTAGLPSYELWPYASQQAGYPYLYVKRGSDLAAPESTPIWPIRGDVLVRGALADCCRWPGTAQEPNLLFGRTDMLKLWEAEFEDQINELERQDEDIYTTWITAQSWVNWPLAPMDARFMQSHAY